MLATRIRSGDVERIQTPALKDGSLVDQTGLTTVVVAIQRTSDGFWYDFNDDTFKSTGWTTRQQQMAEVSTTLAAGEYYEDWDTSAITNETADDTYMVRVDETGGNAVNVPLHGEIKIDQWVDDLFDEHGTTQADIAALNDIDQTGVQSAMTAQGYTSGRASNLDDLDAAVSSRATQANILSDATPFAGANIDAAISSRSDFDETANPVELLDTGGTAGTSAAELVTDIETDLAASHGAGQWDGTDSDWTAGEREQIRYRLAIDGTQTDPTTGAGTLEDILADTDAVDTRLPSVPADESSLQAAIATRSSHTPADVDTTLTAAHGAGSWESGAGIVIQDIVDAILEEAIASHVAAGNVAESISASGFAGKFEEGKWEITELDGGTMIIYESDNTTEVARFALYDADGNRTKHPSVVASRVRL